ncbi:MAG TPA: DUF4383 domain-containing protein [Chitinophagaceae bacterium]|nr:DUF4383 domain-containing protein [Chitinophagaceae bacterium]
MNTKTAAIIFGLAFLAVGALGFIDNPIVGESADAIFHADQAHNIVHLVSGALFLLVAFAAPAATAGFLKLFGIVYLGLGIWGLVEIGDASMATLLGFLHVNANDNYLHIGLGALILLAGFLRKS